MEIKMCAMSDLHGQLPQIRHEVDILCICGDIVPCEIQCNFYKSFEWLQTTFYNWIKESPVKNVVMIWGNHDFIGEKLYEDGVTNMSEFIFGNDSNIHILCDTSVTIEGINFYGTSWCPNLSNWAFYGPSSFLKERFSKIPYSTDILLTHCPPRHGQQGVVLQPGWNYLENFGCYELEVAIQKIFAVKSLTTIILSGHIHSGNHQTEVEGGYVYRNVSLLDEDYKMTYSPDYFTYFV
jgi:Icc-related predicted phosphoesterase